MPVRLTDDQRQLAANHLRLANWLMRRRARYPLDEDDAIQEACIGLLYAASRYDPDHPKVCKVAAFLGYGICSRLSSARTLRRYWTSRRLSDHAQRSIPMPERSPRIDYDLDAALTQLGPADRTLLHRYYLESVPTSVLSAEAGITSQAMTLRLRVARRRLRKILEEQN